MIDILIDNFLGFLAQLLPCALLIFLPFPQEDHRFSRKKIFTGMTLALILLAAAFSAVICFRDMEKFPSHTFLANTFMTLAILPVLLAFIFLVRESLIKKLMVFFVVFFYAITEFVVVNMVHKILYPDSPGAVLYTYPRSFTVIFILYNAVMLPIMIPTVIEPLKEYLAESEPHNIKREFGICAFSTFLYCAVIIYSSTTFATLGYTITFLPATVMCTFNQILVYWLILRESVRRKRESDERQAIEIQQIQYDNIVNEMENTRRMRHDLRHHYNTLCDMLGREQYDEMKNYLSRVIDTTVKRDNEVYCKNLIINGLLQYYVAMAREEDIKCTVQAACGDIDIEPVDLTVLFGNAMENAIIACRDCSERWIKVQIGTVQGSLAIEISNSCREVKLDRRYQTQDGFSPAKAFLSDRTGESFGLRSIAHTAHKYDGSAAFRFNAENETFTARVRLNIHMEV